MMKAGAGRKGKEREKNKSFGGGGILLDSGGGFARAVERERDFAVLEDLRNIDQR